MDSHSQAYRKSWTQSRRILEQRLAHSAMFAIPIQVIDWAIARGVNEKAYAWLSHDWLVISNRHWNAERADRLVVIPMPDSVELRLYHDGTLTQRIDIHQVDLDEEIDRLLSKFGRATES
jgi:hypothetical protein